MSFSYTGEYLLPRNHKASLRLNFQHWMFKERCGYLIHPSIEMNLLSAPVRIADVGTGTALWPVEVASSLKAKGIGFQIHGFDVSAAQYPRSEWMPENVALHEHDTFKPYPEEFHGKFDLVHMQALTTILTPENVDTLVDNVTQLLKPGGYLQWVDGNPMKARIGAIDPTLPQPETERTVKSFHDIVCCELLDRVDLLAAPHAMSVVNHERLPFHGVGRSLWQQNHIMIFDELLLEPAKASGNTQRAEEAEQRLARLSKECDEGAYVDVEFFCIVMQKSSV